MRGQGKEMRGQGKEMRKEKEMRGRVKSLLQSRDLVWRGLRKMIDMSLACPSPLFTLITDQLIAVVPIPDPDGLILDIRVQPLWSGASISSTSLFQLTIELS